MRGGAYPSRSGLIVAKMMPNAGLYVRTQPRKIAISSTMAVIIRPMILTKLIIIYYVNCYDDLMCSVLLTTNGYSL